MSQQSQAQAQAQISALQQQNAMLNQHLHTQAQSHINHLQQLIPFHQPPQQFPPTSAAFQSTQPTPVPQAPDPPAPTATPANQPGSSTTFNRDEMLQQMKSTVESSIQEMVEKTQERQVHPTPPPSLPGATSSHPTSHHPSILQHPPPRQRSSRRSRSHHHGSPTRRPDKRPVSIPRSPRRRRSTRRVRRSSRPRSSSREFFSPRHASRRQSHVHHPTLSVSTTPRRTTSCTRSSTTTGTNPSTSYSSTCIVGIPPTTAFSQHQPSFTLLPLRPIDHQQVAILGTMEGLFQFLKPTQSIQMD